MKIWGKLYTYYAGLMFGIMFLILFPLFFIIIQKKKWHRYGYHLNKFWAKAFFASIMKPVEVDVHPAIDKNKNYIFCANHFSYLDIPVMGFTPNNFVFVGKSSIKKAPLFGYMFDKLHLAVNRKSKVSSYDTYKRSSDVVKNGRSLVMFPEGGILTKNPPNMTRFKDGAFRIAIEQQISIIPVTIPFNWIVLPDKNELNLKRGKLKIIFHEPIEIEGMLLEDLQSLKCSTFQIIDDQLKKHIHANAGR